MQRHLRKRRTSRIFFLLFLFFFFFSFLFTAGRQRCHGILGGRPKSRLDDGAQDPEVEEDRPSLLRPQLLHCTCQRWHCVHFWMWQAGSRIREGRQCHQCQPAWTWQIPEVSSYISSSLSSLVTSCRQPSSFLQTRGRGRTLNAGAVNFGSKKEVGKIVKISSGT